MENEIKKRTVYKSKFRKQYGKTIKELAALLDVSIAMVQKWHYTAELKSKIETKNAL